MNFEELRENRDYVLTDGSGLRVLQKTEKGIFCSLDGGPRMFMVKKEASRRIERTVGRVLNPAIDRGRTEKCRWWSGYFPPGHDLK